MPLSLQIGHASHVGLERETNEDSYLVMTPPAVLPPVNALLVVADGVGGTNAGEVASGMLVESFLRWFQGNTYGEQIYYNPAHADFFVAGLKDLLESVNERLYQTAATRPEWAKMGTTATVGLFSNGRLFVGHVGDTRAYLLRNGVIQQLTTDHSWVADEVAAGRLTEAQAQNHPKRNVINRVLGNDTLLRVDRKAYDMQPMDVIILTSDGLTGLVADAEIRAVVGGARTLQEACHQLVGLANQRGGHDNITVLAARVLPEGSKGNDVAGDGVIVNSTYLGRGGAATPVGRPARPSNERAKPALTVVAARPSPPPRTARPSGDGRLGVALLLFVAGAAAAAALAFGAVAAVRDHISLFIGGLELDESRIAGLLVILAVLIGFFLGYLGRQWLTERHAPYKEGNS